ncbi:MAG: serine/threonine protein kinase [Myxococcales bacterium]|nr:serine/threonine protein kinase [Myxococcales bacterium]
MQGRVDRYELHALLGEGGHGAVYRARHALTQQWVALKLVHVGQRDQQTFDRLVKEARAVAAIGHPHIVKVHDCGVTPDGEGFIAMELVDGQPLSTLAREQGPLALSRAVDLALQVLDALEAAHGAGVVHRDIKPSNVLARALPDGRDFVTLVDFGISKVRNAGGLPTDPGVAMGTPGYMAPEQFYGARDADGRADVYAAGVILFELLAGRRPFTGPTFERIAHEVTTTPAPPLATLAPHVPFALASVVDRALARDVDARWPTARAFADALRDAVASAHVSQRPRSESPHAFLPTLHATPSAPSPSASAPPLSQSTPQLSPQVSPQLSPQVSPLVVSTPPNAAASRERPWAVPLAVFAGVVVVGLLVAIALVGGRSAASDAAAAASPDPEAPGVSKGQTKTKAKAKAKPTSDDDEEPSVGASASSSATAAPGPPLLSAKGHGVSVLYPKVVGDLVMAEITKVAKRALPGMSACRRTVADSVEIAVHVHPGGAITLAIPSPDNKGDATVARCVATAFKTSAIGWKPGESGIITLQADLDAK